MLIMNIFEYALRNRLRFNYKGIISTEDLYNLNLTSLDNIFKELNQKNKEANEESLLADRTIQDEEIDIKIQIIKHIVALKIDAQEAHVQQAQSKQQKQKVLKAIADKQDESLNSLSVDELNKLLKSL